MEAWAIKDWDGVFERHDTRRYERLTYVCKPVGQHSIAYLRLASTDAGIMALGVFDGLVTAAAHSRSHKWRGILGDEGGEWSVSMLSSMTGMSADRVAAAIQVLSGPGVGWLVRVPCTPRNTPGAQSQTHPAHTSTHTRRTPSSTISAHTEKNKRREEKQQQDAREGRAVQEPSASPPAAAAVSPEGEEKAKARQALIVAGVQEPTRSELVALPHITADAVRDEARKAAQTGKGLGVVVLALRDRCSVAPKSPTRHIESTGGLQVNGNAVLPPLEPITFSEEDRAERAKMFAQRKGSK